MYQLASLGDHWTNPAECVIQTFKNHFIAIISGTDPDFLSNCWDLLAPQAVITFNLLRPSQINPAIFAYAQINDNFDFNDIPLALAGCRVIIHGRANERPSSANHGTQGFYLGPANHHYRNYQCYKPGTKSIRVSNTVEFFPHHTPFRKHNCQTKSYWFSKTSLNYFNTQARLRRFCTMELICINVSGALATTYHQRHQTPNHQQQDISVATHHATCLMFHPPTSTKGVPQHCSKGGHNIPYPTGDHKTHSPNAPQQPMQHLWFTTHCRVPYWYNHTKTFRQQKIPRGQSHLI